MDITIFPGKLSGTLQAIPSKSQAHRLLICAAFSDKPTELICPDTNRDIEATASCLNGIGASITRTESGYFITPISETPTSAELCCAESGSTLRFILPIVGALGIDTLIHMEGRLPYRPLSPLWEEMERMGCCLIRPTDNTIRCNGKLKPGSYTIDGGVSSQYITGLLFALSLIKGQCSLTITGKLQSEPYVNMTRQALSIFGANPEDPAASYHTPGKLQVEGDWSNGAFFLAAKSMGSKLDISGLDNNSAQGDKACLSLLQKLDHYCVIDAADIPDLVPILAVTAGAKQGAEFTNIARLRLKESDRVASVTEMLQNFGIKVEATANTMKIYPGKYGSCTINAYGDHRIAMAAAIAATVSYGPVTILGAQCVEKSYPKFWDEYKRLGGKYEQHIR